MHRTLKENTTKPPAASLGAQQSRFDSFRYVFNNERPHEGLNNQVPASLYTPRDTTAAEGFIHPSESLDNPKSPVPANGAPLSVLILGGIPYSRIAASQIPRTWLRYMRETIWQRIT
jgi:hypothetical protein